MLKHGLLFSVGIFENGRENEGNGAIFLFVSESACCHSPGVWITGYNYHTSEKKLLWASSLRP